LLDPAVEAIERDGQGRLWLGTRSGLNLLDPRGSPHVKSDDVWTSWRVEDGLVDSVIDDVAIDGSGSVRVASGSGLGRAIFVRRFWAHLPIVRKEESPGSQATATRNAQQYRYDDGAADSFQSAVVGTGYAVQFANLPVGWRVQQLRFYVANPAPVSVRLWNAARQEILTPVVATPTHDGWFEVDIWSSSVLVPSGGLYVGFTHTVDYQPDIGVDTTSPKGSSYEVDGAYFEARPGLNHMIGIYVVP